MTPHRYKQHLGLIEPQFCPNTGDEHETPYMKPVGAPRPDVTNSEEDRLVMVSPEPERAVADRR